MIKRIFRPLLSGSMLGLTLAFPQQTIASAGQALHIFASSVLPSLFPFTACMLLFTAGRSFSPAILGSLALLGGSPTGGRIFQDAPLSARQAKRLAATTGVMSPMFFLGTLSLWLENPVAGRLIFVCHLFSSLLCSLFFKKEKQSARITLPPLTVSQALSQAASAMLTVGACIVLGTVAARLIFCLFPHMPPLPLSLLQCFAEVTGGCQGLIALKPSLLLPLLAGCTSFSGLSILLQNAAFWGKQGISLSFLIFFGILRAIIAFLVCTAIILYYPAGFAV